MSPVRGGKWFKAGAIGLIVFGSIHVMAVYQGLFVEPTQPAEIALHRAALAFRMELGPFQPTAWHTINILNSGYSVLLLYAGVLNLLAFGPAAAAGRLRALTLANVIFCTAILAIPLALQFPPPVVCAAACLFFFVVALFRLPRADRVSA